MRRHTAIPTIALTGGAILALALSACTASVKGSSSTADMGAVPAATAAGMVEAMPSVPASAPPGMPIAPPGSPAMAGGADNAAASGGNAGVPPLLKNRAVIYTADITVRTDNIDSAVKQVETLASSHGGVVYAEQVDLTSKDPNNPGNASATITLKVPPANLQQTLDAIGRIGTELSRNLGSNDVTEQVVDVAARISAARASIARLTDLLSHQGSVADLLNVEGQLAQRDADLESLEQQQKSLATQTASATITAQLMAAPPVAKAIVTKKTHTFGFLRGLSGGWHAFTKTIAAIATGIGAVLPFAIVLVILAVGYFIGRRKMRGRRTPQEL